MKVYTGTGDRGKTGLFSGERVAKSHARIEAYGNVDELNSVMGALIASLPDANAEIAEELHRIQFDLFQIGAWLATTPESPALESLTPITPAQIQYLESAIDRMDAMLPPLSAFVLPGGHRSAAWAHMARTVCRRAERRGVRLEVESFNGKDGGHLRDALVYLNRLSDYLFVLARHCNRLMDVADILWRK
ncbi:MAG: cob(I)yrinic acid a,c-diamide adenosyltransferase [Desulfobacterales bacterium]|nr:MAG: cob(I)yrinic acid a,c-diamide adenosyltransferase [Desulfobacterales bacterium]